MSEGRSEGARERMILQSRRVALKNSHSSLLLFLSVVLLLYRDHLSEASLTDLSKAVNKARSESSDNTNSGLRSLFAQIPGGEGESMSRDMDSITRAGQPGSGAQDPSTMTPQQVSFLLCSFPPSSLDS